MNAREEILNQAWINYEFLFKGRREFQGINKPEIDMSEISWVEGCRLLSWMQNKTKLSERKLSRVFGLSKSQVHRMLTVAALPPVLLDYSERFYVEKYVLVRISEITHDHVRETLTRCVLLGNIKTHSQIKSALLKTYGVRL